MPHTLYMVAPVAQETECVVATHEIRVQVPAGADLKGKGRQVSLAAPSVAQKSLVATRPDYRTAGEASQAMAAKRQTARIPEEQRHTKRMNLRLDPMAHEILKGVDGKAGEVVSELVIDWDAEGRPGFGADAEKGQG